MKGASTVFNRRESEEFQQFIVDMGLVDVQMLGKNFAWFKFDGMAMSRLDRILVSKDFITICKVSSQWVERRDISDRCPVVLQFDDLNWGPKLFSFNNCWLQHKDFVRFVAERWGEFNVGGWKIFSFREKSRLLKENLRVWNWEVFDILDMKTENVVQELNKLEDKAANGAIVDWESHKSLSADLWQQLIRFKEIMLYQ